MSCIATHGIMWWSLITCDEGPSAVSFLCSSFTEEWYWQYASVAINHSSRGQCLTCCTCALHTESCLSAATDRQATANTAVSSERRYTDSALSHCLCHPHCWISCLVKHLIQSVTEAVSLKKTEPNGIFVYCTGYFCLLLLRKWSFKIHIPDILHSIHTFLVGV